MSMNLTHPAPAQRIATSQLVSVDGRELPLRSSRLETVAGGGLARTRLVQRFVNTHEEPLTVTYQLPLPADGAVSGFAFTLGERRIKGEIDRRAAARARFEQAIVAGHTAALLEQDRSSLFRQEIGNVPPGCEVVAEIEVDQPLIWVAGGQGAWEFRFPTTVAPRFQGGGASPTPADHARQAVDIAATPTSVELDIALRITDTLSDPESRPESPSHAICTAVRGEATHVELAREEGAPRRLDRDVVVRWPVGAAEVGVRLEHAAAPPQLELPESFAGTFGLLTMVPPTRVDTPIARDLTLLMDTSGSMSGRPLEQAVEVAVALVRSLTKRDRLHMVEFSTRVRSWHRKPKAANPRRRDEAIAWLRKLVASGGTDMMQGVATALQPLREDVQTQVVLVTDGLIGFEREVTGMLCRDLPTSSRFHVVGIGESANRSLTQSAARAGRGAEAIVGVDDDAMVAARRIVAAVATPVVVNLELSGSALVEAASERMPDLFGGQPATVSVRLKPEGGTLRIAGQTADGPFVREVEVAATAASDASATPAPTGAGRAELAARFARIRVEDLELAAAANAPRNDSKSHDEAIETVGLAFRIATRRTSWIAVSAEATVDPRAPSRKETMPHELAHGMSVEGVGLRPASAQLGAAPAGAVRSRLSAPMAAQAVPLENAPESAAAGYGKIGEIMDDEVAPLDAMASDIAEESLIEPPAVPKPAARGAKHRKQVKKMARPERDEPGAANGGRFGARRPMRTATLRTSPDGSAWIEITPSAASWPWRVPASVTVRFADGTTIELATDASRSTADGTIADGAHARLLLAASAATNVAKLRACGDASAVLVFPDGQELTLLLANDSNE
ncbi:MAG: VIT domain-containing protein [Planctomycetota bacterium]